MEKGIRALLDVVEKDNSRILLIVDSDMDGYSSSAIIYSYIKRLKDIQIDYSLHTHKQHGLEDHIDEILNSEIKYDLIICPDSASNDKEYIDQLDCPVLILDHHLVDKEISKNAILINNQSSNGYLNKELSGGGVTWQFCRALDKTLGFNFADDYIDLAAFSIIGDMMGLKEIENQAIIHHGTQLVQNKFLKVLCEKQDYSMGGKINPTTVAFYIVPLVNAMIRVGTMEEKERLFQAFVDGDKLVPCNKRGAKGTMERVAVESARECVNAKSHQDKEKVQMADKLEGRIYENGLLDNKVLIVELNDTDTFSSELNGLVCMYLSQKFQRPTAVVRRNDEGFLRGSCRGLNESELTSFKNFMDESGLFEYTAG
jgi:single-stranded-DNA-specific exonuclease